MLDRYEALDELLSSLSPGARAAAHADIFADAVASTGLDACSLAMCAARDELLVRAFELPTGRVQTLTGARAVLTSASAPEQLRVAAGHLAAVAAAWLWPGRSEGALAVRRDLRAGVEMLDIDLASRWISRLARGDARILFRDADYHAGVRIAWSEGDEVRLEACHPADRGSAAVFSVVGLGARAPSITNGRGGERSGADVPRGRPLLEALPRATPVSTLRRAFAGLCRAVEHARSIHGDRFELGPLTPRLAWWTDDETLVLHHVGFERTLRDAECVCTSGRMWDGPYSPEAMRKSDDRGAHADAFYIAALFHRIVAGPPRFAESTFESVCMMRDGSWPSLAGLVPAPLARTLSAALSPRSTRPTSSELGRAFEASSEPSRA